MPDFAQVAAPALAAIFIGAALAVWFAGAKLSTYADLISDRTGMGHAMVGMGLLAISTSLPEIATTLSASAIGAASLAASNLLGGVSMQTAMVAVADGVAAPGALTFFTPNPILLMQGVLLMGLLALAILALGSGWHPMLGGVGLWSILIAGACLLVFRIARDYEGAERWRATEQPDTESETERLRAERRSTYDQVSSRAVYARFAAASVTILIAGWLVAMTGDSIADRAGLGESFVGATLVALSTSLPELSVTVSSVRLGAYSLAIANIFGSNALMLALFLPADLLYADGSIFAEAGPAELVAAATGLLMTGAYLWGLLERRDRSIARLGVDSWTILILYAAGLVLLYRLR